MRISPDTVTAMSAVVIGVAALFVAWDQARIMRRSEHAAMLPILTISQGYSYGPERVVYSLTIENKGVGPALVRNGVFAQAADATLDEFAERIRAVISAPSHYSVNSASDVTLAVGESSTLVNVEWVADNISQDQFNELTAVTSRPGYEICFCSVYDRCWLVSTDEPLSTSRACSAAAIAPRP